MDFRISAGAGKFVLLLAGREGTPFNELDFAEGKVGDSKRREIIAMNHWGVGRSHSRSSIAFAPTSPAGTTSHWCGSGTR